MAISLEQIKEELSQPKKKQILNQILKNQNRIKFHSVINLSGNDFTGYLNTFLGRVKEWIAYDKYLLFASMLNFPLKTNELTATIYDKLSRVFDGRNPVFNFQFTKSEFRDDWEYYRQEILNEPYYWVNDAWEYFKTEINSVMVVDMPADQAGDKPAPYSYFVTPDNIISYDLSEDGCQMNWIIFKQHGNKIAVFDDESFRVFDLDKDGKVSGIFVENKHDLRYCPARFFWSTPIEKRVPDIKEHPLMKSLDSLDHYLFFAISKRVLDLYGSYPIYSGYQEECNYTDGEDDEEIFCSDGYLKNRKHNTFLIDNATLKQCPICAKKRLRGAGGFISLPIPSNDPDDNQPDLRDPVQMLTVDVASLEYNVKEAERLRDEIIKASVGIDEEVIYSQAINEMQVAANFEGQTTILGRTQFNIEQAWKFRDETIARLRYGNNAFLSAKISLGTETMPVSTTSLRQTYKSAKENGASMSELTAIKRKIIDSEYRNDPNELQRMLILLELEPYVHYTLDELNSLRENNMISDEEFAVKINFDSLIRRFERENTNIIEFGVDLPMSERINLINEELYNYVNENRERSSGEQDNS